jgi:glycosyltransferase involved in cell wall biosynthesis
MLSDHGVAVKSLKKKAYLSAANLFKVYKNIAFHVTDDLEAIAVKKRIKSLSEVKIAWQFPRKLITKDNHNVSKQKDELLLISIARIAPEKNILFALQCLHQLDVIKNKNLKVVFNLYGTVYSSDYWEQCQNVINNLPDNIKVYYHGALDSTRVMEVIGEHHFLFMPSCGENFGHTILESLSAGCPVIISDKTPWRNLEKVGSGEWAVNNEQFKVNNPTANSQQPTAVGIGWDLPLDEPQRFVEVIEYCAAMGQEEYNTMSQRAFKYAQTIINDPKVLEVNRKLFE